MKIFLAGGTGFVGYYLRKALLERGHQLILLTHRRRNDLEQGVEQLEGDATRPETFAGEMAGCAAAINLIGIIREYPGRNVTFEKLHVEATGNLLEEAHRSGVKRYLQMSALGTRANASATYHQTKFRAEALVHASGLDYTIFRPSLVFGPKDDFINKLAGYIRNYPVVPVIGDGTYRLQPIAVGDVARCFTDSLELAKTIGKTYELCGPDRISYNQMLDTIGRVLGKNEVRKLASPLGIMKLLVPLMQGFSAFPITMDQITMLIEENICDGCWRETFTFEPLRFEEGIRTYLR